MKKNYTYIDIFAGCGGLSLGLYQAGWKGLFAIEKSPFAFSTLKHNLIKKVKHFDWPSWLDVKEHDINDVIKKNRRELKSLKNSVDLVAGGPPCQGFSTAGKRIEGDRRNQLIFSYIEFIRIVQPRMIFFENVKGFTQKFKKLGGDGGNYSEIVQNELKKSGDNFSGYNVEGRLIDFSMFGVPQKRTRFILIGVRKDLSSTEVLDPLRFFDVLIKKRTSFLRRKGLTENMNTRDALSDLEQVGDMVCCPDAMSFSTSRYGVAKTSYQELMRKNTCEMKLPDSHRFTKHNNETIELFNKLQQEAPKGIRISGEKKKIYNVKKRGIMVLSPDKPAPTITSHPDDFVHYSEPRILSVRECARIQSFPDWFEFKEKYTTGGKLRTIEVPRYTQVGNAIPPLFSEQVGNALKEIIDA